MSKFTTVGDLMDQIQEATAMVANGDMEVDRAAVAARNYGTLTRLISIRIEQAKLTERMTKGSSVIPDAKLE